MTCYLDDFSRSEGTSIMTAEWDRKLSDPPEARAGFAREESVVTDAAPETSKLSTKP
jgi:hypothetical protein